MDDKNKQAKIMKIPSVFKKQFKEKDFNKKILKWIQISKDKELVQSIYTKDADGNFNLMELAEDKEQAKKLKIIAGAIKNNKKGFLDIFKIALLIIIVGGVIAFNLLFKNALIKRAMENGLESAFNAKALVTGVRFEILNARVGFLHLEVANQDSPMKNLFELGKTEVFLNFAELLKGKVVINNIECQNIDWNTDRKTSGALVKKQPPKPSQKQQDAKKEAAKTESATPSIPGIGAIDTKKIVDDNLSNLSSLSKISNIASGILTVSNKVALDFSAYQGKINEFNKTVADITNFNLTSIQNPADIQGMIAKITNQSVSLDSLKKDVEKSVKSFDLDKLGIDKQIKDLQGSFDKDFQFLKSQLQLPQGGAKGIASSLAESYIKERFGKIYDYALKAKYYAGIIQKTSGPAKQKPPQPKRRQGYDVVYPTKKYPPFLIQNIGASVGKQTESRYIEAYVKDISSDADLWNKPITFKIDKVENRQDVVIEGFSDSRSSATDTFGMNLQTDRNPLKITEGLALLNAESLSAVYYFKTGLKMDKNDNTKGNAMIILSNVQLETSKQQDILSKVFFDAIKSVPAIVLEVNYTFGKDGSTVDVKNNIDSIVSEKMGKAFSDMAKKYENELKAALLDRFSPELKKAEALFNSFKSLDSLAKGDLKSIDSLKGELDKKKKEIDGKMNELDKLKKDLEDKAKEAAKKLEDAKKEAERQAQEAKKKAEEAKKQAEDAKKQAEDAKKKAEDLQKKAKDLPKLPGM